MYWISRFRKISRETNVLWTIMERFLTHIIISEGFPETSAWVFIKYGRAEISTFIVPIYLDLPSSSKFLSTNNCLGQEQSWKDSFLNHFYFSWSEE